MTPEISIKVNLPDDWVDQVVERLKQDGDLVRVTRCKDCKYNRGENKCLHPDSIIKIPDDTDFCSYGKPKEQEEQNNEA